MARRVGEIGFTVKIEGAQAVLRAFRDLPTDATKELRDASTTIADSLVPLVKAAGIAEGQQAAIVAPTVRAVRDRVPAITAGGSKRIGRRRVAAGRLVAGSEFGADYYHQFRPHLGQDSYWFFKTAETQQARIEREWLDAADSIVHKFRVGG